MHCSLRPNDIYRNVPQMSIRPSPLAYIFSPPQRSHRVNPSWPLKVQILNCEPSCGQSKIKMYAFDKWAKSHWRTESCGLILWSWTASIASIAWVLLSPQSWLPSSHPSQAPSNLSISTLLYIVADVYYSTHHVKVVNWNMMTYFR